LLSHRELTDLLARDPLFNPDGVVPGAFTDDLDFAVVTGLQDDGATELTPEQTAELEDAIEEAFSRAVERSPVYDEDMLDLTDSMVESTGLRPNEDGDIVLDVESIGDFISADGTYDELDMSNGEPTLEELFLEELEGILADSPTFGQEETGPIAFFDDLIFTVPTGLEPTGATNLTPEQTEVLEDAIVTAFGNAVGASPA
jgi:hypothetical protein